MTDQYDDVRVTVIVDVRAPQAQDRSDHAGPEDVVVVEDGAHGSLSRYGQENGHKESGNRGDLHAEGQDRPT